MTEEINNTENIEELIAKIEALETKLQKYKEMKSTDIRRGLNDSDKEGMIVKPGLK